MKQTARNGDPDMLPEYDFSEGVRGKYAARFATVAPKWIEAAAEHDTRVWLGQALLNLQELEATLVAYMALVFNLEAKAAGRVTVELIESPAGETFQKFWHDLAQVTDVSPELGRRIEQVLTRRNWIVHHLFTQLESSSLDATKNLVRQLQTTAAEAADVNRTVYGALLRRCAAVGISGHEAQSKAGTIIHQWAAA